MSYKNIKQIAKYEVKILMRDNGFRFVSLFCIVLVTCIHLLRQGNIKNPDWIAISLPSAIPFANAYLISFFLIFITVFFGGRFISKRRYDESLSSIDIRPFSNIDYTLGKIVGFMIVVLGLDCMLALIAIFINILLSDAPFAIFPYVFYFFTLTLPLFVFVLGYSVMVKGVVKNQAMARFVLLFLSFILVKIVPDYFFGIFDPFSTYLPNVFSDVTGFSVLNIYFIHRLIFFLVGVGMLFLGILTVNRIWNSDRVRVYTVFAGSSFLLLGCVLGFIYIIHFKREEEEREKIRIVFEKYDKQLKIRVVSHDISFKQVGNSYESTSEMVVYNPYDKPLTSFILYLNPGLEITSMMVEDEIVNFTREKQVVVLSCKLQAHETKKITLLYHGRPVSELCYPEITHLSDRMEERTYSILKMGNDFFYLSSDYTLLTPECMWYPISVPTVNISSPYSTIENYTRFRLTVTGEKERCVISQGEMKCRKDTVIFISPIKLTGVSLCMGKYIHKAIKHEGKLYEIYLFKGHEYLVDQFTDPKELIDSWSFDFRYTKHKAYVYNKLALIETPIHFAAYSRVWRDRSEYVQPELIFRPEREALLSSAFKVWKNALNEGISTPQHEFFNMVYLQNFESVRILKKGNVLFGPLEREKEIKNEYDISSLTRKNHFYIYSPEFKAIDIFFQYIQKRWDTMANSFGESNTFPAAIAYLQENSLEYLFQQPREKVIFDQVMWLKANDYLKRLLCKVPFDEFYLFTQDFIRRNTFCETNYEEFGKAFQERFDVDLIDFTRKIYKETRLPSFRLRDICLWQVENPDGSLGLLQSVKVWNKGNVGGVITLAGSFFERSVHYFIPVGACKEIRCYFDYRKVDKFNLEIQTNLSQNIPSSYLWRDIKLEEGMLMNPYAGVFDADTTLFMSKKGEYVVDDRDSGFYLLEDKKFFRNISHWKYSDWAGGYGEPVAGFLEKKGGIGNSYAVWETTLPEEGEYELFVYNNANAVENEMYSMNAVDGQVVVKKEPVQTYIFTCKEGEKIVSLTYTEMKQPGWISLGKYDFRIGMTQIKLSDKGSDSYQKVFADAVKWVKVK